MNPLAYILPNILVQKTWCWYVATVWFELFEGNTFISHYHCPLERFFQLFYWWFWLFSHYSCFVDCSGFLCFQKGWFYGWWWNFHLKNLSPLQRSSEIVNLGKLSEQNFFKRNIFSILILDKNVLIEESWHFFPFGYNLFNLFGGIKLL